MAASMKTAAPTSSSHSLPTSLASCFLVSCWPPRCGRFLAGFLASVLAAIQNAMLIPILVYSVSVAELVDLPGQGLSALSQGHVPGVGRPNYQRLFACLQLDARRGGRY